MITIRHLNVSFINRIILEDISLSIEDNQFIIIKGESGCGKTTLLKSLMLLHKHQANYQYNNQSVDEQIISDHYYMIEQNPIFIENMTIYDHLLLVDEKFYEDDLDVLEQLNIKELYQKYPNQLSQGERKRTAIAIGLLAKKDVLIIDEPTSSLNSEYALCIAQLLKAYARKGHTVICSNHDLSIEEYADDLYLIHHRQIECLKKHSIYEKK